MPRRTPHRRGFGFPYPLEPYPPRGFEGLATNQRALNSISFRASVLSTVKGALSSQSLLRDHNMSILKRT